MAGSLGRDHGNVHVSGRYDAAEVDVEAMGKHQHVALLQVGFNVVLVQVSLLLRRINGRSFSAAGNHSAGWSWHVLA